MNKKSFCTFRLVIAGVAIGLAATAQAATLMVAGSPAYDPAASTGLMDGQMPYSPGSCINNSGTAVGFAYKYVGGTSMGSRAVRWDATGTAATELGNLGTDTSGVTNASAYAVNEAGTAVGYVRKYVGGTYMGLRAVRWDALGTAAIDLDDLGTDSSGSTSARAYAVNDAGTAVGNATKYIGGTNMGRRAVRWDASGTAATELGNLGTDSNSVSNANANAVNDAGTAVGFAYKYVGGASKGYRAVRWDALGTAATELGGLGSGSGGSAMALAVNNIGTAVGWASQYPTEVSSDRRAVRWDASGTVATVLGNLGLANTGSTRSYALAVNDAGTAVGYADKYVNYRTNGIRAVRWDASDTVAIELGNLGTDGSGIAYSYAYAVNGAGTAVGSANKYVAGSDKGSHAVIWLPDATVIDLNDLGVASVPSGGSWVLTSAKSLSSDGWVAGEGSFDPDGAGYLASYGRLWVAQVGLGGNWTKADGGTWGRGPNWSTGTPAMQVGSATFNLNSAYTVALDRDETTKSIALNAGSVTIDFAGHTLATESGLTIAPGATLLGVGTIAGAVLNAGAITRGTLNIEGDLMNTGTLEFEIAALSSHDEISVSGAFSAGGSIAVTLADDFHPAFGDSFQLMSFGSFADGGYAFDFSQGALAPGLWWDTSAFAATGRIAVVPEPATLSLLILGLAGTLVYPWRRRKTKVILQF